MSNISSNSSLPLVQYSEFEIIMFHVSYVLVMVFGIFGNLLTCTVILLRKSMRRPIHWYTFNLAVCDIMILFVYVPTQMVYLQNQLDWTMGLFMCRAVYVILPVSLLSTVGTLLAITIDRMRGLITPFSWRADSKRNAKITIPFIWLISLLVNIPLFIIPHLGLWGSKTICSEKWPDRLSMLFYWNFMFIISFAIPLIIIIGSHLVMVYVMLKDKNPTHRVQNKRMIYMIIALVLVFSLCTGFQHLYFYMIAYFQQQLSLSVKTWDALYISSNFVVSLQAALNPVIYGTLRNDFKRAFKIVILKFLATIKLHQKLPKDFIQTTSTTSFSSRRRRESFRRLVLKRKSTRELHTDSPLTSRRRPSEIPDDPKNLINSIKGERQKKTSILLSYINVEENIFTTSNNNHRGNRCSEQSSDTSYHCLDSETSQDLLLPTLDELQQLHSSKESGIFMSENEQIENINESIAILENSSDKVFGTPTEYQGNIIGFLNVKSEDIQYDVFHTRDNVFSKIINHFIGDIKETQL